MTHTGLAAVLWDMDGTILDSEPIWAEAEVSMLQRFGIPYTEEIRNFLVGSGLWDAAERFRQLGVDLSADEIVAEWVAHVEPAMSHERVDWRPGARELLADLAAASIPCALVTMSVRSIADRVIELLPPGTFSVVVAGDEVELPKPHPEPYLQAAEELDIPIERCLVIEDSPTGLRSAAASGAIAIGVPNMVSLADAPAHAFWSTLADHTAASLRQEYSKLRN